jgi:hypothetical protein
LKKNFFPCILLVPDINGNDTLIQASLSQLKAEAATQKFLITKSGGLPEALREKRFLYWFFFGNGGLSSGYLEIKGDKKPCQCGC